ncbi:MAG TPA: hypothetical protein V6C97_03225 [Oculatellaceae cyanobacterium]
MCVVCMCVCVYVRVCCVCVCAGAAVLCASGRLLVLLCVLFAAFFVGALTELIRSHAIEACQTGLSLTLTDTH